MHIFGCIWLEKRKCLLLAQVTTDIVKRKFVADKLGNFMYNRLL